MEEETWKIQGSFAWLEKRKEFVTATDVAILMGYGKYDVKTPLQLYNKKKGLLPETAINPAMLRGNELEPLIVASVQESTSFLFLPVVCTNGLHMASMDGLSPDSEWGVEAKFIGKKAYDSFTEIPEHHYFQLIGQFLAEPKLERIIYAISNDGDAVKRVVLKVEDHQKDIDRARIVATNFYNNHLQPCVPPPLSDKDSIELMDEDVIGYGAVLEGLFDEEVALKANIAAAREALLAATGERNCRVGRLSINVAAGRRSIDYKAAMADHSIAVELYMKTSEKKVVTIRRVKQ